jgi:general stress protein 26
MNDSDRRTIKDFLSHQPMATISTLSYKTGKPEAALIAFVELDNLEIVFETFHDTRKYQNLQQDPSVALVVGWNAKKHITLQYEGIASEIPTSDTAKYIETFLNKDTPCTEKFLRNPKVRLFKIRPSWIRFSDYTGAAPKIVELDFTKQSP